MPRNRQDARSASYENLWDRPGYLVRRAHQRYLAIFEEECAKYAITPVITPVQYAMLTMLIEVPRLDPTSLTKAAGADEASGVSSLRRLQTLGLVERDRAQLDLRKRPVRVTDAGRRLMVDAHSAMQRAQERLIEVLPREDRSHLIALLKTVVGAGIAAERSSSARS
jgi:DNA-binding MarR family transcriptional regulator